MQRSDDAPNYLRGDERVDRLYAHRPIARGLLAGARTLTRSLGALCAISTEGRIACTLQGLVNAPRRSEDLADLRALLRANRERLDIADVREHFRLFERETMLDELLKETD